MMHIEEYEPRCGWAAWHRTYRLRMAIRALAGAIKLLAGAAVLAAFPFCYMLAAWLDQLG